MHFVEVVGLLLGIVSIVFAVLVVTKKAPETAREVQSPLDYDQAISLDAEELAEQGIEQAYRQLLPRLRAYTADPWQIEELIDADGAAYAVRANGEEYRIQAPPPDDQHRSWVLASVALFSIVNRQLERSEYCFYALYGDNDLQGIFLTQQEAAAARRILPRKEDWPYLLVNEPPWFGAFH